MNNHLNARDDRLAELVASIKIKIQDIFMIEELVLVSGGEAAHMLRQEGLNMELNNLISQLPDVNELLERDFTCDWGLLYEVLINDLRNSLLNLQQHAKKMRGIVRSRLCCKVMRMEAVFGHGTEQYYDAIRELNNFDDNDHLFIQEAFTHVFNKEKSISPYPPSSTGRCHLFFARTLSFPLTKYANKVLILSQISIDIGNVSSKKTACDIR